MENKKSLRFAPLVRVSSEQQKKRGESLRTQRKQIEDAVKILEGIIPNQCWEYSGQESATPQHERKILEKLLKDSSKGLFDAVIVADPSRWSRDNIKNEQGLEIILQNNIQFYVLTTAYDLNDPQARLFLAMNAIMNQYQAKEQARKSIRNRKNKIQRGVPSIGKLPYGRSYGQ
jgi:DNA invertase Pin-like site-specific DNA recombinase